MHFVTFAKLKKELGFYAPKIVGIWQIWHTFTNKWHSRIQGTWVSLILRHNVLKNFAKVYIPILKSPQKFIKIFLLVLTLLSKVPENQEKDCAKYLWPSQKIASLFHKIVMNPLNYDFILGVNNWIKNYIVKMRGV